MKYKTGDTLIEVTLAIGIFSMIAIAVVAVMNSGTSGAQTALETTLAREEIDAQAEALRFIHTSYVADKDYVDKEENRFERLWQAITDRAVDPDTKYTVFSPKSCEEAYSSNSEIGGTSFDHSFIINTRKLGDFTISDIDAGSEGGNVGDSVILTADQDCSDSEKCLQPATTYPRLIYSNSTSESLVQSTTLKRIYRAEGIYILAVRDHAEGTTIAKGENTDRKPAFYDFYIRTCWYGSGSNTPSTISTVMRLYDPDALVGPGD